MTGHFKNFIIFSSIIIIHELGHILMSLIFKWNIERVILLPFGGITIFKENIDKSFLQEFLIALFGPLLQIIYCLIFNNSKIFFDYNIAILLFNLLPIYPLDGSKILNIFFNIILPFKISHVFSIVFSILLIVVIFIFLLFNWNIMFLFILFFLSLEIYREINKHKYYFNRFLLERYLNNFKFKKTKVVKKIDCMKRQTTHIFQLNGKRYTEYEIIRKMFDK